MMHAVVTRVAVVFFSLIFCVPALAFEYSGDEGPAYWHELDPAFEDCGLGVDQSPIDIHRRIRRNRKLGALELDLHDTEIHLENNGHTIEQEYEPGSTLTFDGVVYELLQFHFHTLAEHTIDGERHPMELHAVFRDASSGNLAVVGQLFRIDRRGKENDFLDQIDGNLPEKKDDVFTSSAHINVADAFASSRTYYTYDGSLTTPPCSPIVTWIVLRRVAKMSQDQFEAFREILGNNFRPLQDRDGRTIYRVN